MSRILFVALAALALVPAAAQARPGEPDNRFGQRGTITFKALDADAVGGAVKVVSGNRVLAGGAAAGQFVVVKLRPTGSLDRCFGIERPGRPVAAGTSLDGVRAIATFRDGRIVAAGTLLLPNGDARMVAVRFLPSGEIDPSFGGGLGYVVRRPGRRRARRDGDGQHRQRDPGRRPPRYRGRGDRDRDPAAAGRHPDASFAGGTVDGAVLGLSGRVTSLLVRPEGTLTFTVGAGPAAPARRRSRRSGCSPPARSTRPSAGPASSPFRSGPAPAPGSAPTPCAAARRRRRSSPAPT